MPRDLVIELAPDDASAGDALRGAAARRLGLPLEDVGDVRVRRRGIDARHGVRLRYDLTVYVAGEPVPDEPRLEPPRLAPVPAGRTPVVIVGAGPAGLFAALRLAERGIPAVVIERGKPVQARRRDLAAINKQGVVDPESNYCFGEGGAGTYSDGKLYTRAGKRGPVEEVLRTLVAHGAPASVLIDNRPHIGSNRLPGVVMRLRHTIEGAGIPVRFGSRLAAIEVDRGRVAGVRLATGEEIGCAAVVLAAGHSARDVLAIVARAGVRLEPKPFAAGVRVEHPQPLIDAAQYGRHAGHPMLPAASYRFATTVDGRGVFSFCMCPGGWIVPSATEQDAVVVNGMSLSRRDSPFANSGVVVAIEPADLERLGYVGAEGALRFQTELEELAARLGGGAQRAPAQRVPDLIAGRESADLPRSSYRPGLTLAPLHEVLPPFVVERLRPALRHFARTLRGFDSSEGVAVAIESRTSSPVRIVRDPETLQVPEVTGLYPCGEGAGYAGGIASAAVDGLRVASRIPFPR